MTRHAVVYPLADPHACVAAVAGAKAANIARAAIAGFPTVPGFVITTAGVASGIDQADVVADVRRAFDELADGTAAPLVVRSSSTIEDAGVSSMAGRFTSVLDVVGWEAFVTAVHAVIRSGEDVRDDTGTAQPMAVLVQRQLVTGLGGVLFGVDPVTGSRGHVVVEAVPSRPDVLVSGTALADHYVLSRRGRVLQATRTGSMPALDRARRRSLVRLALRAEHLFGAPQDIEWCVDTDSRLWLLQSRPVTAVATDDNGQSVLLGPGPVAETFPSPLRQLEDDLWIQPLRDGITRALLTTGAVSEKAIRRSPVVTTVSGWAAVDLELIGLTDGRTTLRRRMNPFVIIRRLGTAWRVGRLRVALPALADAIVSTVDRDLAMVPRLDELTTAELAVVLDRARRELATVHAHEVLAGMLLRGNDSESSAAGLALRTLHDARAAGWDDAEVVSRSPVVLVLSPPSLDVPPGLPADVPVPHGDACTVDGLGSREALRLRARWLQELEVRLATELGRRLADEGSLSDARMLGELHLSELLTMAAGGPPPSDLGDRHADRFARRGGPPLPAAFRLAVSGEVRPAGNSSPARRRSEPAGLPAGGGRAVGVVRHRLPDGPATEGSILVTRHLEPQLAPMLGGLVGLVSETGSALSHLAILAREVGLPTVAGVTDALRRFPPGTRLLVDGGTGEIEVLESIIGGAVGEVSDGVGEVSDGVDDQDVSDGVDDVDDVDGASDTAMAAP
ncbi:MAG TPA: PEP/pyruvate-binding domain-containing protein [Ilumatobacteraceae bacterium]|nr:PEP/pyruvate-binding domain-containing protein [Ilumatobacteraceae bacterium]